MTSDTENPRPARADETLLSTKLYRPTLIPRRVRRARLLSRLDEATHVRLILISAPPGFGKTTIINEWIETSALRQAAWLSLDGGDNDPARFFRYLVAAWRTIFPNIGRSVLGELDTSPLVALERLCTLLLNDLQERLEVDLPPAGHGFLTIDDYHLIEYPPIHEAVAFLIDHLPARLHLVLTSRIDPPLPLPRWRSRSQLIELRADDLRFNLDETADLLNRVVDLKLSAQAVATLEQRTEGWVVGLQMAALSLKGRADQEDFVRAFSGSHRYILDYLLEEVLQQQVPAVQEFLLGTSILSRMSASLCEAVLEKPGVGQGMLEYLERNNLFVIPLDDERRWFRYHHLFADLLQLRLQIVSPERVGDLHRQAADWHARNALWQEAVQHALAANDPQMAIAILEKGLQAKPWDFLFSGIALLVERFPEELVRQSPLLCLLKAARQLEISNLNGISPLLKTAEEGFRAAVSFPNQCAVLGSIYGIQGAVASLTGDVEGVQKAGRQAVLALPEDDPGHLNALIHLGVVHYYQGDLNRAYHLWEHGFQLSLAADNAFYIIKHLENLSRLNHHRGLLRKAEELDQRAFLLSAESGERFRHLIPLIFRDRADLLREWNHLDEALRLSQEYSKGYTNIDTVSGQGLAAVHLARILFARDDLQGAEKALGRALRLRRQFTIYPDLMALIQVLQARLLLSSGDYPAAQQVLETGLEQDFGRYVFHREWLLIAQSRLAIRMGNPASATAVINERLEAARAAGRGRNYLEMLILLALAWDAQGEPGKALGALARAVQDAEPEGWMRIFIDEGPRMCDLLREGLRRRIWDGVSQRSYVNRLLNGFGVSDQIETRPGKIDLVEELSEREREVLRLVYEGYSNQEIAARLVLALGTVKTHVHNIFGKLGVNDRPQAIARARELGIFDP